MNYIKSTLIKCDAYGTDFHFYVNHHKKYKTIYGGILTIITIILLIISIIVFGGNFFLKKNPTITSSSVNGNYSIINLKNEKVLIAFRLEDLNGNFMDFTNKIYPMIYYYSRDIDNNSVSYRSSDNGQYLSYHICNDSDYENDFNLTQYYGHLFCIDWNNKNFGGYWDNNFLFYFEIRLYYCKDGKSYTKNNTNCTSLETLSKLFDLDNPMLFSLYYPIYDFNSNSFKNPLVKSYKNYFYYLSHKLQKIDRLFIEQLILKDDRGWIYQKNNYTSVWGVQKIISDYSYYTEEELLKENSSSLFYTMNIYMTKESIFYSRFYIKIQEVIAIVGGLIGFCSSIIKIISNFINGKMIKVRIIDHLFDFDNYESQKKVTFFKNNKNLNLENTNESLDLNNNFDNNVKITANFMKKNTTNFSVNNIIFHDNIQKNVNNNIGKKTEINIKNNSYYDDNYLILNLKNKCSISFRNAYNLNDSLSYLDIKSHQKIKKFPTIKLKNLKNSNIQYKKLSLCRILMLDIFCIKTKIITNGNEKTFNNIYFLLNWIYRESIEINNYLDLYKLLYFLKKFILNNEQNNGISHLKKLNLVEISELKDNYEKKNSFESISKLIHYYQNIIKKKNISHIDYFTFETLDENIKKHIE